MTPLFLIMLNKRIQLNMFVKIIHKHVQLDNCYIILYYINILYNTTIVNYKNI